jgi:hypothetical protein
VRTMSASRPTSSSTAPTLVCKGAY